MVISYVDLYTSLESEIPIQDWYDPAWHVEADGASAELYRDNWSKEDARIYFRSFGQGEDPEQNPVILELVVESDVPDRDAVLDDLEERIEEDLKPLIGWKIVREEDVFIRKELPSDPLTLLPRILEEFKKLQPIAVRIDQHLGLAPEDEEPEEENPEDDE